MWKDSAPIRAFSLPSKPVPCPQRSQPCPPHLPAEGPDSGQERRGPPARTGPASVWIITADLWRSSLLELDSSPLSWYLTTSTH